MFKLNIIDDAQPSLFNPSHLNLEYLAKYGNGKVFVETGTYMGDTVKLALEAGFEHIHSIELNDALYERAKEMFKDDPKVTIWHGDSIDCLVDILKTLNEPATFWLDAHASGELVGGKSGGTPVWDEVVLIKQLNPDINSHTIFIDDRRLFGSAEWSFVKEKDCLNKINEINPEYNVVYLDGHVKGDVICATVKPV